MDSSLQMAAMQQAQAAQQAQQAIAAGQSSANKALTDAYNTGRGDVNTAVPKQTGALQTGYNTATQSIQGGLNNSLSALGQGYDAAGNALSGAYNTARGDISGGSAYFDPYYNTGTAANMAYANAMGLNGAAGNAAAQQAFQAGPGYQWMVDQATNNAMRKAGAAGMLGSGNTYDSLARLASGLAGQEWNNYLSNLSGLNAQGMQAAGAKYQGAADMANLANNYGQNTANLASEYSRNRANAFDAYGTRGADLATGLGSGLSGVYGDSARTLAGLTQGYGTNTAGVAQNAANAIANIGMTNASQLGNIMGQQSQINYAQSQQPWLLASGVLGGLSGIGAGLAGNPGLFK